MSTHTVCGEILKYWEEIGLLILPKHKKHVLLKRDKFKKSKKKTPPKPNQNKKTQPKPTKQPNKKTHKKNQIKKQNAKFSLPLEKQKNPKFTVDSSSDRIYALCSLKF